MARDAIAEIMAPGQRRRQPVGQVFHAGKEAAQPPDGDADSQRQREDGAGAHGDAGDGLVAFDPDDGAEQRPLDGTTDARQPAQPEIGGAEPVGADGSTDEQRGVVGQPLTLAEREGDDRPAAQAERNAGGGQPGENVEQHVRIDASPLSPIASQAS